MLVDVHCHLNFEQFKNNLPEVIERAKNMAAIVCSGTDLKSNKEVLDLSEKYDLVKPSFGLYPFHAVEINDEQLEEEIKFIEYNKDKIYSIGEIGLDYSEDKNPERQKEVFVKLLNLAKKLDKPVVIHSRKAEKDCIDLIEEAGLKKVVMHCFCGNFKLVERIQNNNWYFSIPANIVRLQHFQKVVETTDISKLLTETDAPFLSPYKEKINEPIFVKETIKIIASIKNLSEEEVEKLIYMNFQNLFLK
ncbi:TatD family hydrolase [archaeon]|nr:TatD family hydrolase [archaeon]